LPGGGKIATATTGNKDAAIEAGVSHKWPEDNANPQIQEGAFSPTTPDNRLKIRRIVKNHKPGALPTARIAAEARV
jgi:hypothetical protein